MVFDFGFGFLVLVFGLAFNWELGAFGVGRLVEIEILFR